jgi:hypothetical protein
MASRGRRQPRYAHVRHICQRPGHPVLLGRLRARLSFSIQSEKIKFFVFAKVEYGDMQTSKHYWTHICINNIPSQCSGCYYILDGSVRSGEGKGARRAEDRQLLWHLGENEILVGEVTPP